MESCPCVSSYRANPSLSFWCKQACGFLFLKPYLGFVQEALFEFGNQLLYMLFIEVQHVSSLRSSFVGNILTVPVRLLR